MTRKAMNLEENKKDYVGGFWMRKEKMEMM